jgi:hypothetical protein
MKGFFRVVAGGAPVDVDAELLVRESDVSHTHPLFRMHPEEPWIKHCNMNVPAAHIVSVQQFNTFEQYATHSDVLRGYISALPYNQRKMDFYVQMRCDFVEFFKISFKCSCAMNTYVESVLKTHVYVMPDAPATCTCPTDNLFPLYEITVKNKSKLVADYTYYGNEIHKHNQLTPFVSPTITYLVHPDERQHMQRFLAGTDESVHDLIQELRYHPAFGSQTALARQDFDERMAKRGKTDEAL